MSTTGQPTLQEQYLLLTNQIIALEKLRRLTVAALKKKNQF